MDKNNNKDKIKKLGIFKAVIKIIPKIFKTAPGLLIFNMLISIVQGILIGSNTIVKQHFFDKATELTTGDATLSAVFLSLAFLGLINIFFQIFNGLTNFTPQVLVSKCAGKLSCEIHDKISRLSAETFEDTDKLDDINKANLGKDNAVEFAFIFLIIFFFYVPYFIFMGWYLYSLKPIFVWSIIIIFIPTALTQLVRSKVFTKLEDKSAPVRREYEYYERCMVDREYFKETRLLGGFNYFKRLYIDTLKLMNKLSLKANIKTNLLEFLMKILSVGGYIVILYMLFDALMKREISVGAFAAVFSSIGLLYMIMEEVVCQHIGSISNNLGTIKNYLNFLELEERKGEDIDIPSNCDITLDNANFSYPKAKCNAVENANLVIKNKETLAIVGENGSGKSTIIRLITGVYKPTEGEVKYGNVSTDRISMKKLFENSSAVFQKYCRYQMKLSENISISDTHNESSSSRLDTASEMANFSKDNECFTDGYDTMLSREFDGIDLSGGQWQRIAIARAFFKKHNLIILDEPTASIDPFEETRIYNRFAKMAQDKTAIIVTHRIGSVKIADRIVVMKDGKIAQIGTHDELISKNGEYKRMYTAQQQWYQE